ncbi:hypothetical protein Asulf_00965 [Archaeoglobus sulfaticallidus PM70-1]|uniref:CopG family transcriptional regulator n=1 Tax=Archaeoglobus sulfaticallidus PM70-1 TaxID=387631 RepID=N0BBJ6_9EURY|nr:hypothetical protein [Archaeoglobus sulfaticallidus]AGK60969.1 hypothetical protein Asulf_00965 [Archaeoglobus sulfaticallidus PM70-1]
MGEKVWADVPERWKPLIKKAKDIEGWDSLSAYIRELIKKDLVSKGLLGQNGQETIKQED